MTKTDASENPNESVHRYVDLRKDGWSQSAITRAQTTGSLTRLHRGIYLDREEREGADAWLAVLAGHVARGRGRAAVSHRSAAVLHRLDGFNRLDGFDLERPQYRKRAGDMNGWPVDIAVPVTSGFVKPPAIRSSTFDPTDSVLLHRLPVTSIGRTLADVGRFVSVDVLECAVESALRPDAGQRPDTWNRLLLADLRTRVDHQDRLRPTAMLREVLRRRGEQRPTGSIAETILVQELRRRSVELVRQPTVRFLDRRRQVRAVFYPDFADLDRLLAFEVNGMAGHASADQMEDDARRSNLLGEILTVRTFSAKAVLANAKDVGHAVASSVGRARVRTSDRELPFGRIFRTNEGLDVVVNEVADLRIGSRRAG